MFYLSSKLGLTCHRISLGPFLFSARERETQGGEPVVNGVNHTGPVASPDLRRLLTRRGASVGSRDLDEARMEELVV